MDEDYLKHFPNEIKCIMLESSKQLRTIQVPLPRPGYNEVLVHVKSCGLTNGDLQVRQGDFNSLPKYPFVPGFECSGKIVYLGSDNIIDFDVGDRVICLPKFSAWSEYIVVNVNFLFKIPDFVSYEDANVLAYDYLTAYILLFEIGCLKAGQCVLYHMADGGVASALEQLCSQIDDITTFRTLLKAKSNPQEARINNIFDENEYVSEIKKIKPEGVDLVLDCLCGEHTNLALSILKPLGRYVLYGNTPKNNDVELNNYFSLAKNWLKFDKISPLKLYQENLTISGLNLFNLLHNQSTNSTIYLTNILSKLFDLYKDGKIKPRVDCVYSFDNVHLAYTQLQQRKNIGKILLDPYYEIKEARKKDKAERVAEDSSDTDGPDEILDEDSNDGLL